MTQEQLDSLIKTANEILPDGYFLKFNEELNKISLCNLCSTNSGIGEGIISSWYGSDNWKNLSLKDIVSEYGANERELEGERYYGV